MTTQANAIGGGFHHVAMKVADFEGAIEFYADTLGFTPVRAWGEGDQRGVMLDAGDGMILEMFAGGSVEAQGEGTITHFCLKADDVDAAVERVRAAGMTVTVEPKRVDIPSDPMLSVRLAFFTGPNGETVELFKVL